MKGEIGLIPQHHLSKHPQPLPSPSHCCDMVMLQCLELCLAQGGALQDLVAVLGVHLVTSMPSSQTTVGHLSKSVTSLARSLCWVLVSTQGGWNLEEDLEEKIRL